jgi:dephospho-CoA kinase
MSKIILGFVGQLASGKGTATEYLKKQHNANTYRFSSMLRDIADRLYLEQNRNNLQKISRVIRENFSEDILSKVIAQDAAQDTNDLVVIDGIRRPADIEHLSKIPGFILVHIFADIEKRFDRITSRGENTDDNQKTFEQFQQDHKNEAELLIGDIATQAIEEIDNNGTTDDLHTTLDALMKKYKSTT